MSGYGYDFPPGGGAGGGGIGAVSAGTQSTSSGTIVFSNSNNVSFGMNNGTITATATFAGGAGLAISAGTQSTSTGTVSFSNLNGISFGMANSSVITASYTVPSTAGHITGINISAGGAANNSTNFIFSNSNNVSFGLAGNTITATISVPAQTNQNITFFATGNTTQNSSTVLNASSIILSANNGQTIGFSNGSIVVSGATGGAGGGATLSQFLFSSGSNITRDVFGINQLQLVPLVLEQNYSFSAVNHSLTITISTSSNSSHAGTLSFTHGVYTRNANTLSLYSSSSGSWAWTNTSNNSVSLLNGPRNLVVPFAISLPASNYWYGFFSNTSTANANWITLSNMVASKASLIVSGAFLSGVGNASEGPYFGFGQYGTTTTAMPASIAFSQIRNDVAGRLSVPFCEFINMTA